MFIPPDWRPGASCPTNYLSESRSLARDSAKDAIAFARDAYNAAWLNHISAPIARAKGGAAVPRGDFAGQF